MGPDEQDEPLHDLGVLFVHGIGQSARAETLLHFGEPLRKCIEDIAKPVPMSLNASVDVSIAAARLDPEAGQGPARAELRISKAAVAEQRWLLAEAWWAKKFPTPTVGEIVTWSFEVLPWTLMAHFDRRFRRMCFQCSKAFVGGHPIKRGLPYLGRSLLESIKTVIALALLPLLLAILLALTLLGMVPYAPVRDFARTVQRQLAATIGDSFVLMDQPIIAAAITDSVRENLEWLAARCKRIAVVAHSQGGAIAHRVLRGPVTAPCDLLVTFGSGLGKLSEIEHVKELKGWSSLLMATVGAFIAAVSLFVNSVVLWSGSSVWALFEWLAKASWIVEAGMFLIMYDLASNLPRSKPVEDATFAAPGKPVEEIPPSWHFGLGFVLLAGGLVAGFELVAWRRWDTSEIKAGISGADYLLADSEFPAEALLRLGRFLRYEYPTEAKGQFRLALQSRSAPASVELYKMLQLEGNEREANEVLDIVLSFGRRFARDVSELFEKDQQVAVASELKKRAEHIDETLTTRVTPSDRADE
jgi:hypothetical protein